jgi:hypothetical protein
MFLSFENHRGQARARDGDRAFDKQMPHAPIRPSHRPQAAASSGVRRLKAAVARSFSALKVREAYGSVNVF